MKGILHPFLYDAIDKHGFRVADEYAENKIYYIEMEFFSDLGEDMFVTIRYDGTDGDFVKAFLDYYDDFDIDDHVAGLIPMRGKYGIPSSISDLVHDAESTKNKLLDLSVALTNALADTQ